MITKTKRSQSQCAEDMANEHQTKQIEGSANAHLQQAVTVHTTLHSPPMQLGSQQAVTVIGFYVLYGLIGGVTKNWLLPLARPRAQEPGDYTSYLQSSSGLFYRRVTRGFFFFLGE